MATQSVLTARLARWRAATLAPFRHRTFAMFWWASMLSYFGTMIQTVAASWLMTSLASSADMVALVQTAGALPSFFLSLIAGALADTYDRRLVMLSAQIVMTVAAAALAALGVFGELTPWLLLTFTFLIGCGAAVNAPTWQAAVSGMVPREQIPAAVALNSLGFNAARSIGPALGGAVVAAAGATVAFVINAASNLAMILTLLIWRPARVKSHLPPEPLGAAILAGLRYVSLSPPLRAILVRCGAFTFCAIAVLALMPLVARDSIGGGALMYGALLGGFGLGAMAGALANAVVRARLSIDTLTRLCCGISGAASIVIGLSPSVWLTFPACIAAGGAWMLTLSTFNISTQLSSPRWVTGRTIALYQTISFAGVALGSWVWGLIAHQAGLMIALCAAGLATFASLFLARWAQISQSPLGELDPWTGASIAHPQVDLDPRIGPVVLTIEYRVPLSRAVNFAAAMHEFGRIRRRDGARRWSLSQDLDDPEVWVERFETPTWYDHLRRHTRATVADQKIRARVMAHVEGGQGVARRYVERPPDATPLGIAPVPVVPLSNSTIQP